MITGITSTMAETRTIRFQAIGAFPRVSTVFQIGRATNANEKTIAAHLRKNSSPTPMNVAAKKKTEIEITARNVTGPKTRTLANANQKNGCFKDKCDDAKCSYGSYTH
jgi:hypothetical protein